MSLREQFEAWFERKYPAFNKPSAIKEVAARAYKEGHTVNAELLEALETVVNESVVVYDNGKYSTAQITSGVLDEARAAIKKARGE